MRRIVGPFAYGRKLTLRNGDLDTVRMSAFGHKQPFRFNAYTCILTVNECLLSAISGHSEYSPSQTLAPKSALAALYVLDGDQQVAGKNN